MGDTSRVEAEGASAPAAPETPDVVIGNHLHKYTARNPLIRALTERFLGTLEATLDGVQAETPAGRVLEVGCGEGEIAARLQQRWGDVSALDLPDAGLRSGWQQLAGPRFLHADAQRLPFADASFDLVVAIEVLEHLRDPEAGLREMARVSGRHLLLSVPREPLFRMGNFFTGRHVRALGNTPGHLNHWSAPSFLRFVSQVGAVRAARTPFPWTVTWVRKISVGN